MTMTITRIDFVLVWEATNGNGSDEDKQSKRDIFEKNLKDEGLILEREHLDGSKLHFTKINAPIEVLRRYTEILKLRMPMKDMGEGKIPEQAPSKGKSTEKGGGIKRVRFRMSNRFALSSWFAKQIQLDETKFPPESQRLSAIYSRDKEYLFDINEHDFFKEQVRGRIVDFIIRRKRFSDDTLDGFAFGIDRLINEKVYFAAYPLHDGDLKIPGSVRNLLFTEWASLKKFYKHQPLDLIKEYFGVQIGLYYAWLGYYTQMLIPVSILGILCFVYGVFTLGTNSYSEDVCNGAIERSMCPLCDHIGPGCEFWNLTQTCTYSRITYMFDNNATILFAVLMSLWAAIFTEFWKRYSAQITHKWDLSALDKLEEQPRLEYLSRLKKMQKLDTDIIDVDAEPYVPFWKTRVPFAVLSLSIVVLMVSVAGAIIIGIIAYRVSIKLVLAGEEKMGFPVNKSRDTIIVSASSACINLILIVIFNNLYTYVAQYLTELELHRTQTEFDDSITLKIYVLQFVNFYASIFYVAFFKGRLGGYAPNSKRAYLAREECGPAGCMADLCIQLSIIMVGKQFANAVVEMTGPLILKWISRLRIMAGTKKRNTVKFRTQWSRDVKLLAWNSRSLFSEYLEMILQYGFITIFVAAFPLAPFFALLNNIMEMRLDATKMLMHSRRPVGLRVKDIGIWSGILQSVSKLAVISNALIIAFTSSFIPKLVYYYKNHRSMRGFLSNSLTSFNATEYNQTNVAICMYAAHHYNYSEAKDIRYTPNSEHWEILAARLAFVVIFENVVNMCVLILKAVIPDVPKKLQKRIRYESNLTNEIIIQQEMIRAREATDSADNPNLPPQRPFASTSKPGSQRNAGKQQKYSQNDVFEEYV